MSCIGFLLCIKRCRYAENQKHLVKEIHYVEAWYARRIKVEKLDMASQSSAVSSKKIKKRKSTNDLNTQPVLSKFFTTSTHQKVNKTSIVLENPEKNENEVIFLSDDDENLVMYN